MSSVSISDVARRAGVSRATVSRVLNGSTEALVTQGTRTLVRQAVEYLGYHPSAIARGLAGKPMNTVGIILAYELPSVTTDPFLSPVLDGILAVSKRERQKTIIFVEDNWEDAFASLPVYCDGHCDGLVLVAPCTDSQIVGALQSGRTPFVLIGDSREMPGIAVADIDNVAAARLAVGHLLAQGHRRIAALCGNRELLSSHQRLQGYTEALAEWNVPQDNSLILPGQYWEASGSERARLLMELPIGQRPTALFCQNERIAVGALEGLLSLGIRVPQEVSIIGIGDYPAMIGATPALTTVHIPLRKVGERAVEMLLSHVQQSPEREERTILTGWLIERGSTAPPVCDIS